MDFVKRHLYTTGLFLSVTVAKILHSDQWYSNKAADVCLARTLLERSPTISLQWYILKRSLVLGGIRVLSRVSLTSALLMTSAIALDYRRIS